MTVVLIYLLAVLTFSLKPNYVELIKGKTHNRFSQHHFYYYTSRVIRVIIFIFMSSNITNAGALVKI